MSDLAILVPELVLAGMALALILVARHVRRAQLAGSLGGPRGGSHVDLRLVMLDRECLEVSPMMAIPNSSVSCLQRTWPWLHSFPYGTSKRSSIPPAEYYALLLLATTGMMFAAASADLLDPISGPRAHDAVLVLPGRDHAA